MSSMRFILLYRVRGSGTWRAGNKGEDISQCGDTDPYISNLQSRASTSFCLGLSMGTATKHLGQKAVSRVPTQPEATVSRNSSAMVGLSYFVLVLVIVA